MGIGSSAVRIREWGPDLFGRAQNRWRVIRTSNAYTFNDPQAICIATAIHPSKSELPTGTTRPSAGAVGRALSEKGFAPYPALRVWRQSRVSSVPPRDHKLT
jgi:hypothetical protein